MKLRQKTPRGRRKYNGLRRKSARLRAEGKPSSFRNRESKLVRFLSNQGI